LRKGGGDNTEVDFCVALMLQGVVISIGEHSEFGSVFRMMQTEEVCTCNTGVPVHSKGWELGFLSAPAVSQDTIAEEHEYSGKATLLLLTLHHRYVLCVCMPCHHVPQLFSLSLSPCQSIYFSSGHNAAGLAAGTENAQHVHNWSKVLYALSFPLLYIMLHSDPKQPCCGSHSRRSPHCGNGDIGSWCHQNGQEACHCKETSHCRNSG